MESRNYLRLAGLCLLVSIISSETKILTNSYEVLAQMLREFKRKIATMAFTAVFSPSVCTCACMTASAAAVQVILALSTCFDRLMEE